MSNIYDIIIIGGGPAGLSAAIYSGRARMKTLVIEGPSSGGQICSTAEIENYPGGIENESGPSLMERFRKQALYFGAEITEDIAEKADLYGDIKTITCRGSIYKAKAVIIASGASPAKIGCPGEDRLTGMGVSFCATCDGAFFEGLPVYVVGGGDAAVEEAMYLTRYTDRVTLIHRRESLRAADSIIEKAKRCPGLSFMWNSVVTELKGENSLNSIVIENVKSGVITEINASENDGMLGLFEFIGLNPNSALFPDEIKDQKGYILTDEEMQTMIPGVFAAGDIRLKKLRQVVTAAADGAIAAVSAAEWCRNY